MDLSQLQGWLAQLNLDWLKGLIEGAIGMWILNKAWDYFLTRRKEKRQVKLGQLDIVDEWLEAMSKILTSMRYEVEKFVEEQKLLAQGRMPKDEEELLYFEMGEDLKRDSRMVDDMFPKVLATLQDFPALVREITELALLTQVAQRELTTPMEKLFEDIERLGDPEKITKQQIEKVVGSHRRSVTDGINSGLKFIEEARGKLTSAHREISRLRQK